MDVVQALRQGKIEMAVPGTWNVTQFEPNVGIFMLPFFYGKPAEANYRVLGGSAGKILNKRLESNLQIKVVGRWIDLGHAHLFGTDKKILRTEDIKGLRVRIAGGVANKLRIEALGGNPVIVPWPDLPEYMRRGRVDAVLTSYETVQSAKLWEKGIKYAFEDREYFPQYIPMIRLSFWNKLSPDIQRLLVETWEKHVDISRKQAAEAQFRAKKILIGNGVEIVVPSLQLLEKVRSTLLTRQNDFVREMNMDTQIVMKITDDF
jgi:C4-dicarboxylate-binding protein DctP